MANVTRRRSSMLFVVVLLDLYDVFLGIDVGGFASQQVGDEHVGAVV